MNCQLYSPDPRQPLAQQCATCGRWVVLRNPAQKILRTCRQTAAVNDLAVPCVYLGEYTHELKCKGCRGRWRGVYDCAKFGGCVPMRPEVAGLGCCSTCRLYEPTSQDALPRSRILVAN